MPRWYIDKRKLRGKKGRIFLYVAFPPSAHLDSLLGFDHAQLDGFLRQRYLLVRYRSRTESPIYLHRWVS